VRLQFAWVIGWHILMPAFTVGMASYIEGLTAFFLEPAFLGAPLFGRKLVPPRVHFVAALMVAGGMLFSSFWIFALNSWMQTPASYAIANGRFLPKDWFSVVSSPLWCWRSLRGLIRKGRYIEEAGVMFLMTLWTPCCPCRFSWAITTTPIRRHINRRRFSPSRRAGTCAPLGANDGKKRAVAVTEAKRNARPLTVSPVADAVRHAHRMRAKGLNFAQPTLVAAHAQPDTLGVRSGIDHYLRASSNRRNVDARFRRWLASGLR
jgi:hypothetical protein